MKPLGLLRSVVYFGASALLFRLCVYQLLPLLMQYMPQFWAFIISYTLPLSAFILATFLLLRKESTLSNWKSRLRLKKLTIKQAAVSFGIFVVGFLLTGLLLPTAQYLASTNWFAFPSFLPDILNPNRAPAFALTTFLGVPLSGAYWVVVVYFIFLTFFNILGEELWFRGYILPRQELVWGKRTWIVHGLFWCLFHTPFYPWTIIYLLPTTLTVSYAAQRFQSTWAGFIVHYLGNGILAMLPIVLGVVK